MKAENKFYLCAVAYLAAFVGLAGCSTTPQGQQGERFAVEAGVVMLIEQSSRPAVRAAEVVESVDRLQNLLEDEYVTVTALQSALLKRVNDRPLSPGEKVLALQVVGRIAESIETRVGKGYLSPESIVSINQVLTWAENMAALYVAN